MRQRIPMRAERVDSEEVRGQREAETGAALNTEFYRKPWATDRLSRAPRDRLSHAPHDLWSTSGPPRLVAPPRTGSVRSGAPFRAGSARPCGPDAPGQRLAAHSP